MEICYKSKRMARACNNANEAVSKWGPEIGKKVLQRLAELKAADTLMDLSYLPSARCHELKHNRKGQYAVDLKHLYRLVFKPANDPVPLNADGGIDRVRVTAVLILEVIDYHGN